MTHGRVTPIAANCQTATPVWKNPGTVLITGATGGLETALAHSYARPGRTLVLHGRDPSRLAELCRSCEARGARVVSITFDLRDAHTAVQELRQVSERESIDLAIVNAGATRMIGAGEEAESWDAARAVLAVNLDGALDHRRWGTPRYATQGFRPNRTRELPCSLFRVAAKAHVQHQQGCAQGLKRCARGWHRRASR